MDNSGIEEGRKPSRYIKRALAEVVARATTSVVVLEGASGVGKTALVKNEAAFQGFHYVTLADEDALAQARRRPRQWAMALPRPVVIDDAHRAPALVATIRRLAPKKPTHRPEFVLVSSRALPEDRIAAPEPERFTLFPLTQAEICGRAGCIVDDLFDGAVHGGFRTAYTRGDLRTKMRVGGFPYRVLQPARALSAAAKATMPFYEQLRILNERDIGPQTTIEQLAERAILEKVLANPGISLGVDAAAHACGVNAASFTARLQEYRDSFLIHRLNVLDKRPTQRAVFAKSRIHPMDTVLALEALRAVGHDIAAAPPVFAKVLRTLCVNQLVPAARWAREPTECCHWKGFDRRVREVDLVLHRGERIVGITVRNSRTASPDTIGALRLLAKDERFARGYIVYMGADVRQLTDNIWALPVSALWDARAFTAGSGRTACSQGRPACHGQGG